MPLRSAIQRKILWVYLLGIGVLFSLGILCFPDAAANGVRTGMDLCLLHLVPSTFPFLLLTSFFVSSGSAAVFGRLCAPITERLFRLPGCCGGVILLSWLGGYPTGARGISTLYRSNRITKEQGERMLWFCVAASPSLFLSLAELQSYHPKFGLFLFLSQIGILLLLGICFGLWSRVKQKESPAPQLAPFPSPLSFFDALFSAIEDSANAILPLCAWLMLFAVIAEMLSASGIFNFVQKLFSWMGCPEPVVGSLLSCFWEINLGLHYSGQVGAPIWLMVAGISFGGLCLFLQILSTVQPLQICKWKFFLARLLHSALSVAAFFFLKQVLPFQGTVTSVFSTTQQSFSYAYSAVGQNRWISVLCGGALLLSCIGFLLCRKGFFLAKSR